MDDPNYLCYIDKLSSNQCQVRQESLKGILATLETLRQTNKETSNDHPKHSGIKQIYGEDYKYCLTSTKISCPLTETLQYTVNRFIHGLYSDRNSTRLGYAVALGRVIQLFPNIVTPLSIALAIHFSSSPVFNTKEDQKKDHGIACLLGYRILYDLNFFKTPDSCQVIIPIMDDLWTLYDQKIYFQDPAAILLCHIVSNHKSMTGTYPQELNSHCEKMIQFIQDYPLEPTMRLELGHRNENHLFGFLSFYLRLSIENDSKTKKKTLPSWLSLSPFVLLDKLLVILCNQSATGNLQYRIPDAWRQLVRFLVQNDCTEAQNAFEKLMNCVMNGLKHETRDASLSSSSLFGFKSIPANLRLVLEILTTLKIEVFTGRIKKEIWFQIFWNSSGPFLAFLLYHTQPNKNTSSFYTLSQTIWVLLTEIVLGAETSVSPSKSLTSTVALPTIEKFGLYCIDEEDTKKDFEHYEKLSLPLPSQYTLTPKELLEILKKCTILKRLPPLLYTQLLRVSLHTQTTVAKQVFVAQWLQEPLVSKNEWFWRMDYAIQAVSLSDSLTLLQRCSLLSQLLISTFLMCCYNVESKAIKQVSSVNLVQIHVCHTHRHYIFPYVTEQERETTSLVSQSVSRLGSLFQKILTAYRMELNRMLVHTQIKQEEMQTLDGLNNAQILIRNMQEEFFSPVLTTLLSCMEQNVTDAKEKIGVTLYEIQKNNVEAIHEKQSSKTKLVYIKKKIVSVKKAKKFFDLQQELFNLMQIIIQTLPSYQNDRLQTKMLKDLLVILFAFRVLAIKPFLLACSPFTATNSMENIQDQIHASLYLLKKVVRLSKGYRYTNKSGLLLNKSDIQSLLHIFVDEIPQVLLETVFLSESSREGVTETVYKASQGMSSGTFSYLWRFTSEYLSEECLENLILSLCSNEECSEECSDQSVSEEQTDLLQPKRKRRKEMEHDKAMIDLLKDKEVNEEMEDKEQLLHKQEDDEEIDEEIDEEMQDDVVLKKGSDFLDLLLNEEGSAELNSSKEKMNEKERRFKQHVERLLIQKKLRHVEILQTSLRGYMETKKQGPVLFDWTIKHYGFLIQFIYELEKEMNWILRLHKYGAEIAKKKRLEMALRRDLFTRYKNVITFYCTKLFQICLNPQNIQPIESLQELTSHHSTLAECFQTLDQLLMRPRYHQGSMKPSEYNILEDLEAFVFLLGGLLEEVLLCKAILQFGSKETGKWLKENTQNDSFNVSPQLYQLTKKLTQETCINECSKETICDRACPSSSFLFSDFLTHALSVYVVASHSPIEERFFRSLCSYSRQYLHNHPFIGLLLVPFNLMATKATKVFILRETLCITSDLLSTFVKAFNKKTTTCLLSFLSIDSLKTWQVQNIECLFTESSCQSTPVAFHLTNQQFQKMLTKHIKQGIQLTLDTLQAIHQKKNVHHVNITNATTSQLVLCKKQIHGAAARYLVLIQNLPFPLTTKQSQNFESFKLKLTQAMRSFQKGKKDNTKSNV